MTTKEVIEEIDIAIEQIEKVKETLNSILVDVTDEIGVKKCESCNQYVHEDEIELLGNEEICNECRDNGYGK